MSELMRFRLARAPQKHAVDPDLRVSLFRNPPPAGGAAVAVANKSPLDAALQQLLRDPTPFVVGYQLGPLTVLDKPALLIMKQLDVLEKWLTKLKNQPSAEELSRYLKELGDSFDNARAIPAPGDPKDLQANADRFMKLSDANWWIDRGNVSFSLIVAMLRDPEPSRAVYLNRLMLVFGLIELAAQNPSRLTTANDVYWALKSRSVILPQALVDFLRRGSHLLSGWLRGVTWKPLTGDFNGDGTSDITMWNSQSGGWRVAVSDGIQLTPDFGQSGTGYWLDGWAKGAAWVPLIGDFNGDGIDDLVVWYPQIGDWQVALSDKTQFSPDLGPAGDGHWLNGWAKGTAWVPLIGDFNGDGKDDVLVWYPPTGSWQVALSDGNQFTPSPGAVGTGNWLTNWGTGMDWVALVGDFNGDGKDDIVVWKPTVGEWHVAFSDGAQFVPQPGPAGPWRAWLSNWGTGTDWVALVGDFNGDGKDDIAIWNTKTGDWLIAVSDGMMFFIQPARSLLARRPGISDLYIVRDEWARYEAGELAHIENVMASETRDRSHTRTTETEEISTLEEERSNFEERDTQSTDRFSLQKEASRDSSLNIGVEGSVDVKGQYGTTQVAAHLGGSLDYSVNESQSQATTTAQEIVARAVTRVEERVRQIRTTRSLLRIEEINRHSFKNDGANPKHISGMYRWVDKIKRVQIFRYPNRFLIEFQVPEPGAWLRWLLDNKKSPTISEQPVDLKVEITDAAGVKKMVDLTPDYLDPNKKEYLEIAARYKTLGLNSPPQDRISATQITRASPEDPTSDKEPIRFQTNSTLSVPDGFKATTWNATVQSWHNASINDNNGVTIWVCVGSGPSLAVSTAKGASLDTQLKNGQVGSISQGVIPISVMTDTAWGYNINLTVNCSPLPEKVSAWQIDTYEKIAQAYYAMKRQYDEEIAAQRIGGGVVIEGQSPVQNSEMARIEIKKAVIALLSGTDFTGRDAYKPDPKHNTKRLIPPEIDLGKTIQIAPEIQFIEQAFEWENMTYVLYPYFWTAKDQWKDLADLSSEDPDFARFLRSGSARVVVPARPGFESQAWWYVYFGKLWGGGPAPAPDDDDYLSVAEEIRAQEKPPRDGIPGESWEVRLPTTLVWLDTANSTLPIDNPNKTLDAPPGKALP